MSTIYKIDGIFTVQLHDDKTKGSVSMLIFHENQALKPAAFAAKEVMSVERLAELLSATPSPKAVVSSAGGTGLGSTGVKGKALTLDDARKLIVKDAQFTFDEKLDVSDLLRF